MNCGVSPSTFKGVSDSATLRQRTTPIAGITDQAPLVAATTASKREFQPGIRRRPKDRRSRARAALPIAAAATRSLSSKRARRGLGGGTITVTHRIASAEPPMPNLVPNWKWIDHDQRQRHPQIDTRYVAVPVPLHNRMIAQRIRQFPRAYFRSCGTVLHQGAEWRRAGQRMVLRVAPIGCASFGRRRGGRLGRRLGRAGRRFRCGGGRRGRLRGLETLCWRRGWRRSGRRPSP